MSDPFIWLPSLSGTSVCGSAFLAGKYGTTDVFAVVLELLTSPCACMRMLSTPGQLSSPSTSLPLGRSGHFGCAGHLLTHSCNRIYATSLCVYLRMSDVPVQFVD